MRNGWMSNGEIMCALGWRHCIAPPRSCISKWSKLYLIVVVKGVVAKVKERETGHTLIVQLERLAFSSSRIRDKLAFENFVPFDAPFRSLSNTYLHALLGECSVDTPRLPTPKILHDSMPTAWQLNFLHEPRADGKRKIRVNRDQAYA